MNQSMVSGRVIRKRVIVKTERQTQSWLGLLDSKLAWPKYSVYFQIMACFWWMCVFNNFIMLFLWYSSVAVGGNDVLLSSCNYDCMCNSSLFEPVCGADGLTYFSPCRAGCQKNGSPNVCTFWMFVQIAFFFANSCLHNIIGMNGLPGHILIFVCTEGRVWELQLCGRKSVPSLTWQ